jgi:hypothetical protein
MYGRVVLGDWDLGIVYRSIMEMGMVLCVSPILLLNLVKPDR